jgi:hypothetical protein
MGPTVATGAQLVHQWPPGIAKSLIYWWAVRDLNPRPSRCKRDALPTELTALAAAGTSSGGSRITGSQQTRQAHVSAKREE